VSYNFCGYWVREVGGFVRVGFQTPTRRNKPDAADPTLLALSRDRGETISLEVDGTSEYLTYAHARDGAIVRQLWYFAEYGWELVEGAAEPWELALYPEHKLARWEADALEEEPAARERRTLELAALRASGIVAEARVPIASVEATCQLIAKHFGFALFADDDQRG